MGLKRPSKEHFKSLQYFLNRSQVLAQYRQFLRLTIPLEHDTRRDVRQQIRATFELYRHIDDDKQVANYLRQGREQLKHVSDLVDSAVARQRLQEAQASEPTPPSNSHTESWVDAGGDDTTDKTDIRGRVGTGWPWKRDVPAPKLELEGIKRR